MAKPGLTFAGFLYDDAGDAINGATINLYAKNATTTSLADTTTNSSGYWTISHTPASGEAGEYDVQITSGSSLRRFKFDDAIQLASLDTEVLSVRANEGAAAAYYMFADEGEDAGDRWKINVADGGVMTFGNDINSQGTYETHVTITPNSTVASSTVAIAGHGTVGGDLTVTGATTLNGNVTLGDAASDVITVNGTLAGASALQFEGATADGYETTVAFVDPTADRTIYFPNLGGYLPVLAVASTTAISATPEELNVLDGVTAGTVAASLGVVVDSDKDIGSFRNVTLTGELDAATLDLSSSADIAGDLVLSGGADGALQFTNAGENSIKIPDNQASALIIEQGDNAYITFVTTNSSEAITVAKATTFSAGIADSGTIAAGTWNGTAIDGGYVNDNIISGQAEITSGLAAADELLYSDAGTVKRVGVDTLTTYLAGVNAGTVTSTGLSDSSGVISLDIQNMTASTTIADADLVVIDDGAGGTLRKMTRANFIESAALDAINIDGGAIDGAVIGANSAAAITGTTITANTSIIPDAVGGADIGSTSAEWGDVFIADDKAIKFGDGQDATIEYDEDGTDQLRISGATVFEDNMEIADSKFLEFASAAGTPTTDNTVQGIVVEFLAVEAITQFDAVYVSTTTGRVGRADANDAAKLPAIGIAIEAQGSAGSSVRVLTHGVYRDDGGFGGNMTVGTDLYVSETPGTLTDTAPGDDGDFVQLMGVAVGVRSAFINPDLTIIEVA